MSPDERRVRNPDELLVEVRDRAAVLRRRRLLGVGLSIALVVAVAVGSSAAVLSGSNPRRSVVHAVNQPTVPNAATSTTATTTLPPSTSLPPPSSEPTTAAPGPCGPQTLAYSVSTDRAVYPVGTRLTLTFTVRNFTGAACVFDASPAGRGFCEPAFGVQDFTLYPSANGVAVYFSSSVNCPPGPTTHLLPPGGSYSLSTTLDGTLSTQTQYGTFDQGPGHYRALATWCANCSSVVPLPPTASAQSYFDVVTPSPTSTTSETTTTTTPSASTTTSSPTTTTTQRQPV